MEILFYHASLGIGLEKSNGSLLAIGNYTTEYQVYSFLDLDKMKIEYQIDFQNGNSTNLEFYNSRLFISNKSTLYIYSEFGKLEKQLEDVLSFSNGLYFRKVEVLNSQNQFLIKVFSSQKEDTPLYEITGGYWNRIIATNKLIIVYSKYSKGKVGNGLSSLLKQNESDTSKSKGIRVILSEENKPSIKIFDKKTGKLLNEVSGSFSVETNPILYDQENCYLLTPNCLIKISQPFGEILWSYEVGEIYNMCIIEGKVLLTNNAGLFEIDDRETLKLIPKIPVCKIKDHETATNYIRGFKIGFHKGNYIIAGINESHTNILLMSEINQNITEKVFWRKKYKEYLAKGISSFSFIEDKMIISDFNKNICVFNWSYD